MAIRKSLFLEVFVVYIALYEFTAFLRVNLDNCMFNYCTIYLFNLPSNPKSLLGLSHEQSDVNSIPDTVHVCGSGMFSFSLVRSSESLIILLL